MKQDEEYHFYPNIYLSRLSLTKIIQMCLKIVWNWTASQGLIWLYLLIYFCKEDANGGWKFKTSNDNLSADFLFCSKISVTEFVFGNGHLGRVFYLRRYNTGTHPFLF